MTPNAQFRQAPIARNSLVRCFIKTPHATVIAVPRATGLGFLVPDDEHAPSDKAARRANGTGFHPGGSDRSFPFAGARSLAGRTPEIRS